MTKIDVNYEQILQYWPSQCVVLAVISKYFSSIFLIFCSKHPFLQKILIQKFENASSVTTTTNCKIVDFVEIDWYDYWYDFMKVSSVLYQYPMKKMLPKDMEARFSPMCIITFYLPRMH